VPLALGATAEEILEACAVAISLGGTMGTGETTRVVQYLEEEGLLDELENDIYHIADGSNKSVDIKTEKTQDIRLKAQI